MRRRSPRPTPRPSRNPAGITSVLTVGLTGGIGSGKSAAAQKLAALGAIIVDADAIARDVVAPGTDGLSQVVDAFGADVLGPDGSLDRKRLAARVFDDDAARARLNAIVHPLVREQTINRFLAAAQSHPDGIVVNDVPLLVEGGLQDRYDVVVVVDVPEQTQLERLTGPRGMDESDARARIASQASRADRLAVADHVIDNSGDLDALDAEVARVWHELSVRASRAEGPSVGTV
jgi:dephospho-CoA kinase